MEGRHRQNRVTPFGTLEAVPERGLFMGNRGNLRRADGTLRPWRSRAWICCAVSFRGRRVPLDDPRRYTPLFFGDEAVALAAGHRPCAECRHGDYVAFRDAFRRARGLPPGATVRAADMDAALHRARIDGGRKVTFRAALAALPPGAFVVLDERPRQAVLVGDGVLLPWSHAGYGAPVGLHPDTMVSVLTPSPIVAAIAAGYAPRLASRPA